jgi:hypothetical protein
MAETATSGRWFDLRCLLVGLLLLLIFANQQASAADQANRVRGLMDVHRHLGHASPLLAITLKQDTNERAVPPGAPGK